MTDHGSLCKRGEGPQTPLGEVLPVRTAHPWLPLHQEPSCACQHGAFPSGISTQWLLAGTTVSRGSRGQSHYFIFPSETHHGGWGPAFLERSSLQELCPLSCSFHSGS